jgi:NAD(P)-dependent dehydrogenase (short-subunit alcohol dehydrogenase family)
MNEVMSAQNPPQEEYPRTLLKGIPIGRTATGNEMASVVLFLANNERAGYVNGAIVNATGGAHAGRAHLPPSRRQ